VAADAGTGPGTERDVARTEAAASGVGAGLPSLGAGHGRASVARSAPLTDNLTVKSKVHPKYKTEYHVGNWPEYEQALVRRGNVTLSLSAEAMDAWRPATSGRHRPRRLRQRTHEHSGSHRETPHYS
jgi:hypothetical protein